MVAYNIILIVREIVVREIVVREIVVREIVVRDMPSPTTTALKLFTFCFYIGKNSYQELVRMLFVLVASLDQFHPDFFLVVYHNLGLTFDDPRVECRKWEVTDGGGERLLLEAAGCDGNVWVEGSAVRNRWHKLSFNKIHVFKNLYDEYGGECFTWIDLDTIVLADLSYLAAVDNYFVIHGGGSERTHEVLCRGGGGGGGGVIWAIPERMYIQGSFWKLNLSLYHEILRLDLLFRENGVVLKYDLQSIFAVMAWGGGPSPNDGPERAIMSKSAIYIGGGGGGGGGGLAPYYDGVSRAEDGSMLVIGYNYRPDVMNGLGVWDTKDSVGNHVNTSSLSQFYWGGSAPQRRDQTNDSASDGEGSAPQRRDQTNDSASDGEGIFRTLLYQDGEIHILSLTFDSFFMSHVSGSSDFARLFPFLLV